MKKAQPTGGRPELSDEERRDRKVEVRYSQTEYKKLLARKAMSTARDVSSFIRAVSLDKPLALKPQTSTQDDKMLSLLREMRSDLLRIGVNINQSSKRINSTTDYRELERQVNEMASNLQSMNTQIDQLMETLSSREAIPPVTL